MAAAYMSGSNIFIPTFEASGKIVEQYSRNKEDFACNRYTTITPVQKRSGYYLKITAEEAARVLTSDLSQFVWFDGNDAPSGVWNNESFEFVNYECIRKAFPYQIGYLASDQADWQLLASHAAIYAQLAMTARTQAVLNIASTASSYATAHNKTATAWGGGKWDAGTTAAPYVLKSFNAMAQQIHKSTLGAVRPKDLIVVVGPETAAGMAESQEIREYVKQSPFAMAQIKGDSPNFNMQYGLPEKLYGYDIVVEDAVVVQQKKGATAAPAFMLSDTAFMCARPGGLVSNGASGPSFGTFHVFSYEEMTIESRDDPNNRRHDARIVDDYVVKMVAQASGAIATDTDT